MELREGYKHTEVGVIPEDWEVKEFGDFLKVIGGGAFKSRDSSQTGVKWLKIANVDINKTNWDDESFLPIELIKDNENFLLKEGDYVLALTRPILDRKLKIAKLNLQDVPALLNQRVGKIEVESNTNIDYTYYLFQKFETISSLLQSMAGTDPPNLSNKGIYGIKCGVPPTKAEQTAIATALSDVDALINSLEKLIAKKRNIKQGAMQKLFSIDNCQLTIDNGGWEVKKLGEIIYLQGGYAFKSEFFTKVGIPIIRISDVDNNKVDTENSVCYEPFNIPKEFVAKKGDILIAMSGATTGKIGVYYYDGIAYINQRVGKFVVLNENETSQEFISHIVRSEKFKENLTKEIAQGAQPNISGKQIQSIVLPIPNDKEEQTRIATILSDMDAEIQALESKLEKYRKIKLGMMQNLLTGKIRLI